jgi:hypothetical protein
VFLSPYSALAFRQHLWILTFPASFIPIPFLLFASQCKHNTLHHNRFLAPRVRRTPFPQFLQTLRMTRRASHGLDMAGQAAEEQQQLTPDLGLPDPSTLQRPAESSGMYPNQRRVRPERACRVCKKSFSKSEHLKRHLRSHTKERPYTCTTCGKSYSRK